MQQIQLIDAVTQILAVFSETFEGPQQSWSYFTDQGPEAGYFGTLEKISAVEASLSHGSTSIAAHVHHVVFALKECSSWIHGDRTPRDWNESWSVQTVDDRAWSGLIQDLRNAYSDVQSAIQSNATDSVESIGGALGMLAHAAFHFGAIRQKVRYLRNAGS